MSAPVKNTCPDIDNVIKHIQGAIVAAKRGRNEFQEAENYFWDILNDLEGLENKLEDLRKCNSKLRDWGHQLDEQLHAVVDEIESLPLIIDQQ